MFLTVTDDNGETDSDSCRVYVVQSPTILAYAGPDKNVGVGEVVEFTEVYYLTIEGKGEPAGEVFVSKVEALYPLAYGIKKVCKEQGNDFGVPKLEGLWWVNGNTPALEVPRSEWCWKLLIRMPDFVTKEMMLSVQSEVAKKKKNDLIHEISFEQIKEGK